MIKVLIVDDSAFMRQVFKKNIDEQPEMETVAIARNGKKALAKINDFTPDVITLDIEMPEMNGLETLKKIKSDNYNDIPVIMVSALNKKQTVMKALDLGAFDFVSKPSGSISLDVDEIIDDLIRKIKAAAEGKKSYHADNQNEKNTLNKKEDIQNNKKKSQKEKQNFIFKPTKFPVIAIGASSGGPKTLQKIISVFPANFPGSIIVVQHMPPGFTQTFASRLNQLSNIKVVEAKDDDKIKKGKVFIAPGDYHLEIQNNFIKLNKRPKEFGVRPCVDYMMKTAAKNFKDRVIGIILTGMGKDGAEGMKAIKKHNGIGIVQDKNSALVYGMPQAVIDQQAYDQICDLEDIPERLKELIM